MKIGLQTERVNNKRQAADTEAQKVKYHTLIFIPEHM